MTRSSSAVLCPIAPPPGLVRTPAREDLGFERGDRQPLQGCRSANPGSAGSKRALSTPISSGGSLHASVGETKIVISAIVLLLVVGLVVFLVPVPMGAKAQGLKPGSPAFKEPTTASALPPPPPKFGGVIKDTFNESRPWWPPTIVPPKGAPNVLLIMLDDAGYGSAGTFGGTIPTPAFDRVAKRDCVTRRSTRLPFAHQHGPP